MFGPPIEQRPPVEIDSHKKPRTNTADKDAALGDGLFDILLFRMYVFPCRNEGVITQRQAYGKTLNLGESKVSP